MVSSLSPSDVDIKFINRVMGGTMVLFGHYITSCHCWWHGGSTVDCDTVDAWSILLAYQFRNTDRKICSFWWNFFLSRCTSIRWEIQYFATACVRNGQSSCAGKISFNWMNPLVEPATFFFFKSRHFHFSEKSCIYKTWYRDAIKS